MGETCLVELCVGEACFVEEGIAVLKAESDGMVGEPNQDD